MEETRKSFLFRQLTINVIARISNPWVSTVYEWNFPDIFTAQSYVDSMKRIYRDRIEILSFTEI